MTDCDADHPESGPRQHERPGAAGEHGHGVTASSDSRYITIALGLIVGFLLVRPPADRHQVRRELEQLLCDRFALDHTTLQVDHVPDELLTVGGGTR
jgi:cobalt-zinc-cadmium efflux system protein